MEVGFVILAAGLGSRLGGSVPKPLTVLDDGRTILAQQLSNLSDAFGSAALARTVVVVGHRSEELIAVLPPEVRSVFNGSYASTNTSKSLLLGLRSIGQDSGMLWLNGDVVFDPDILKSAIPLMDRDLSFAVVNQSHTAEEEIKYSLDGRGMIAQISKSISNGEGEAVGINHVGSADAARFTLALEAADPQDYFEAAMETTIRGSVDWLPLYTGDSYAVEVDFLEDLARANSAQQQH